MWKFIKISFISILLFLILFGSFCLYYYHSIENKVLTKFEGQLWTIPAKVFARTEELQTGQKIKREELLSFLKRKQYFKVQEEPKRIGEYSEREENFANIIIVFKRATQTVDTFIKEGLYRIDYDDENILKIQSLSDSKTLDSLPFQQEKITEFYGSNRQERKLKKLGEFPPHMLYAVICAEDKRFLNHQGVDPRGIFRAIYEDLRHGRLKQGGSTITQQLVKNLFLSHEKSFIRKFNEAIMAIILEKHFNKDIILEAYLNEIYLGQRGSVEIRGMGQAADFYFEKDIKDISIAEAALLAGLIPSPGRFSPFKNQTRALIKRNQVLEKMYRAKTITSKEYKNATQEPLVLSRKTSSRVLNKAPYFVDHIKYQIQKSSYLSDITDKDYTIFSTVNVKHQEFARQAISAHLKRLEHDYSWLSDETPPQSEEDSEGVGIRLKLEAALVAINPKTGEISASVGGRNYRLSSFQRVVYGNRQPGSVFKPFVFLSAFENSRTRNSITNKTYVKNTPLTIKYDNQSWSPQNYEKTWTEPVSIIQVVAKSLNVPTVRIAQHVGFDDVTDMAIKCGMRKPKYVIPSISLGSIEATLLEIATAYSVIANGGNLVEPTAIKGILNKDKEVIFKHDSDIKRVVSKEASFLVTFLLQNVMKFGTGKLAQARGLSKGFYGKTGTTSQYHDAWFAGFTKDLVVVTWVGFDTTKNINLPGSVAALPIWIDFMKSVYNDQLPDPVEAPENIVFQTVTIKEEESSIELDAPFIEGTEDINPEEID